MDIITIKKSFKVMLFMIITSLGLVLMASSHLGMNPWWTFTTSISMTTGLSVGFVVQLLSLFMILIARILGIKPGIATILDMLLIGFYINIINKIPIFHMTYGLTTRIMFSIIGLMLFCLGVFFTIRTGLGAGPKDSLTFAIVDKSKKSFKRVKLIFESSTLIIGATLGAPFGIGTVTAAVFTGAILQFLFDLDNKNNKRSFA